MTTLHTARFGRRLALSGACTLVLGGCFGSFAAVRNLWDWNADVHDSKWIKWLVFLGLSIIPVYELFVLADALVLNSVEFWTGSNPIKRRADGRSVTRVATADPNRLRLEVHQHGRLQYVAYCERQSGVALLLLDAEGQPLSSVCEQADGTLELRAGDAALLARLDPAAVRRVSALAEQGQPVPALLQRALGEPAWQLAQSGSSAPRVL
jgi:hypothetical protein